MEPRPAPSAVVWPWRERPARDEARHLAAIRSARRRGLIQGVVGLAVATLVAFVFSKPLLALFIGSIGSIVGLSALFSPLGIYGWITRAVERLGYGIGTALTWLLMPLIFYFLFLPVGLYLRARKRLGITRSADPKLPTYWISTAERKSTRESYDRQF
jgi:hypothetical protein